MTQYHHPDEDQFRKWGAAPPNVTSHNVVDTLANPLSEQLTRLMPYSWHLEGNQLHGMTQQGELVQNIDPAYILTGTDSKGLPVFKKVLL